MVNVKKADGSYQLFDRAKVVRTCLRMRATRQEAESVAEKIEKRIYEGIPTKKILQMIFSYLENFQPNIKHRIDLRESISLLRSKPDFERFVSLILEEFGYEVKLNQILKGKCVEHEIDVLAEKKKETTYVEVKHHVQYHTYTGIDVALSGYATFLDLIEGFKNKTHDFNFKRAMIVCNTKFSDHALNYMKCMRINFLGWRAPEDGGLEHIIEEKKFYPITLIKSLMREDEPKLGDRGIVLLKQLVNIDEKDLVRETGIPLTRIEQYREVAKEILRI